MATLTDEERAAAILGEEVEPLGDEPSTELEAPETEEAIEQPETETEGEEESEEEKPTEEPQPEVDSSFTKQFPNLKGETKDEYLASIETAYDNSFKESLRLFEENKQLKAQLAQAQVAAPPAPDPANPQAPIQPPAPQFDPATQSLLDDVKAERSRSMLTAFDSFKQKYPQVLEQGNFDLFTKASDGVNTALTASQGYKPSWDQLFPAVAGSLGWQPIQDDSKKRAAIKENASATRTPASGAPQPLPPKKPKVSDAEIEAYQKMFTSKTREEAIKDLSEVK
jgi:cell division septum initiation protein DivIVA